MLRLLRFASWALASSAIAGVVGLAGTAVRADVVDFLDPQFLRQLDTGGLFGGQVPRPFRQAGMTVIGEVKPRDRRLGGAYYFHIHLSWENVELQGRAVTEFSRSGGRIPEFAFTAGRNVQPHEPDGVIQLTYDPDGNGTLAPFDLISIDVINGPLNVGVRFADGSIGVYNNLSSGFRWFLIDGNGLTRATLEGIGARYIVDNVVFQPAAGSGSTAGSQRLAATALDPVPIGGEADALLHDALHALFEREVSINIIPASCQNRLHLRGQPGQLPVALLGSSALDVTRVDRGSIRLQGIRPLSSDTRQVAVTSGPLPDGGCSSASSDSIPDLRLSFDPQVLREALGPDASGRVRAVELTAELVDGTAIRGTDVVFVPDR